MIALKHSDGADLVRGFREGWIKQRLKRLQAYIDIGDIERAHEESQALTAALSTGRIPVEYYEIPHWDWRQED